jgi:PAS domain S-box-containing protein
MIGARLEMAPQVSTGDLAIDGLARAVLESSPDIVAVYDAERRLRVISDSCCTLLGLPREQIVGRTTLEMLESSEYLARARDTSRCCTR